MPNPASSLVDQGSCSGQTRDQRGYNNNLTGLRPVTVPGGSNADDGCDIGAIERQATMPPVELVFEDGFEDQP
jgi:hypothetical protein